MVLTTFGSVDDAARVARALLEQRLVACVNLLPSVQSLYWWQGAIEEASEVLAVMKTRPERLPELEAAIGALHPYANPELLALAVTRGAPPYLQWVVAETGGGGAAG